MSKCIHLSGLGRDFFAPLQQPQLDQHPCQEKNLFDHIGGYLTTVNGGRDFYRVLNHALSFFKYLPLRADRKEFVNKFSSLADKFNVSLSIPKTVTDVHNLINSSRYLKRIRKTPPLHPERNKIIAHAYKKSIVDGMNVCNSITENLMFLHDIDFLKLGKCRSSVGLVYDLTCIGPDTIELVDEVYKLKHYQTMHPLVESEKTALQEKKNLSWLKIAKNLPSIVCAVISIAAVFFVSLQVPAVAAISLGLSALWLTFKLTSIFYEKVIVEKRAHARF